MIRTREFEQQHDGRDRHLHRCGEKRGRADQRASAERCAGPHGAPQPAEHDPEQRTVRETRRQQPAFRAGPQAAGLDQHLQHEQRRREADRQRAVETQRRRALAVAEQLRKPHRQHADHREVEQREHRQPPVLRRVRPRAGGEPHEPVLGEAEQRPADDRPCDERRAQHERRHRVLVFVAETEPRDDRRDRGRHDRHDQRTQFERAEQHLEHEDRAAERHVVDGREPRAGAACDHQPAVVGRESRRMGKPPGEQRTDLARRDFAAERRAERDGDDLQQRVNHRADERHPRIGRAHRAADADERPAIPVKRPPAAARDDPADDQDRQPAQRLGAGHATEEALGADHVRDAVAVRDVLDRMQQQREQHAAEPRADTGQDRDDGHARERAGGRRRCRGRGRKIEAHKVGERGSKRRHATRTPSSAPHRRPAPLMRQTYFSNRLMHFMNARRPAGRNGPPPRQYVIRSGSRRMMTCPWRIDSVAFACRRTAS